MSNIFNKDFQEFLIALNNHKVDYLLVGGYAVILHGYSRTTGDMDIWIERSQENYQKLVKAFGAFGMPVFDMTEDNFLHHPIWDVFTFGLPPSAIDVMVSLKGLDFKTCSHDAVVFEEDGIRIPTLNLQQLMDAKTASGRNKDKDDIIHLQALPKKKQ